MDLLPILALVRAAADTIVMPSFRRPDLVRPRAKASADDVVTDLDTAAEHWLGERLRALHPGVAVLGEETAGSDAAIAAALDGAGTVFVIDPLDGTLNFVSGLPLFGMILAVVREGRTVGAIICDPVTGDALVAETGGGAWLHRRTGAAVRLRVAEPCHFADMTGTAA